MADGVEYPGNYICLRHGQVVGQYPLPTLKVCLLRGSADMADDVEYPAVHACVTVWACRILRRLPVSKEIICSAGVRIGRQCKMLGKIWSFAQQGR